MRRPVGPWLALVASLLSLAIATSAPAQGYLGLGAAQDNGFAEVRPDRPISLPADHGAHPDFRIEWWYVTANLKGPDGADYGLQWTLFRSALAPEGSEEGWQARQFWMAHAAVTSADTHRSAERFARGGVGQAGVTHPPFEAWIDDWRFAHLGDGSGDAFSPLVMTARSDDFAYDLELSAEAPEVLQGEAGYSVKSELGQASHYFSQPFFHIRGTIVIDGVETEVTGRAWMDREWSTQPLVETQTGWDWFALRFDEDNALMVYRLRHDDRDAYVTGNWLTADGRSERLAPGEIEMTALEITEVKGRDVPTHWRIEVPAREIDITTRPLNAQSWMDVSFDYWEGPVFFEGSHDGIGYLEMTGY
ncbi:MAG: lipocalin-like domain-containing protein [Pseudomonadota bacterium]